jgi:histidine triad (HIT) family protein
VPHAHIHLVPLQSEKDLQFSNPRLKLSDEEYAEIANAIKNEL